jgi:uncharacterized protein (TIGR00645 family)
MSTPGGGKLERALELVLFSSRWLLAPFYVGMILALALILFVFFRELFEQLITWARWTARV